MSDCVSCNSRFSSQVLAYRYHRSRFAEYVPDLKIYNCSNCGLRQVDHERVDSERLNSYYRNAYRKGPVAYSRWDVRFRARGDVFAMLAKAYIEGERVFRIFELGSGVGYNLLSLKRAFPNAAVIGDEIDPTVLQPAGISAGALSEGNYDVVLFSHVLEHLRYPAAIMRSVVRALNPGGLFVVEVPNDTNEFLKAKVEDQPHLTFFVRNTLLDFMLRHGPELQLETAFTAGRTPDEVAAERPRLMVRRRLPLVLQHVIFAAGHWIRLAREIKAISRPIDEEGGQVLRAVFRRKAS